MYDLDMTGPIGLVIGNEGKGVSSLVKKGMRYDCINSYKRRD